jgi:ATP-binding cassette subfamily B protein
VRDLFQKTTTRYILHARLLLRAAPGLSVLCAFLIAVSGGATAFSMIASGQLIGSLAHGAHHAWFWFGWTAVAFAAGPVFEELAQMVGLRVSAAYLVTTYDMFLEIGTHPYGVAEFDDAEFSGRISGLHQAMRDWSFTYGVDSTWVVLRNKASAVGAFVIAATWRWWVALVVMLCYLLLSKVIQAWINGFFDDLLDVTGSARREATYVRSLLTSSENGKEIRMFGLTEFLIGRFRTIWLDTMSVVWRKRYAQTRPIAIAMTLAFFVNIGAFALLAHDAYAGWISVAGLAIVVQAIMGIADFGPMGDPQTALARNTVVASELMELRRSVGLPKSAGAAALQPLTPGKPAGIELSDVAFCYPTRTERTIERLTLRIPAGQSVGIVGVNGAGKSTLIKLLCGLYPPDAGTIRVDGRDPSEDARARRRIAVIFQDFVHYHLSLRDNVGLGAGSELVGDDVIREALSDAGAADVLDRLDQGMDTILSPGYAEGTDLSGGQWQRVALARAFAALAAGAGVLVLDEPTAALDVRAEAMLFDRFLSVTRGMTTLLVSHRLSSVRHAERIVVIDSGGILEDGSHDELMALNGQYAQMFSLQASRFAAAGAEGAS